MVARVEGRDRAALELREGVVDEGEARRVTAVVRHAVELAVQRTPARREPRRDRLRTGTEQGDRPFAALHDRLEEAGLDRLIRAGYKLLDLITYFTVGPKEARAWTIRRGTAAPQAAAPEQATEGPAGPSAQTPPAAAPSEPLNLQKAPAPEQAPRVQTQTTEEIHPPRWDPLGAAPFAWDLPEPAASNAPVPVEPKRRTRITPVTLGIALLTAAAIATVNLVLGVSISPVVAAAIVLGVVGTGLVAGAFRRGGYGLLAVAIPLAGFVIVGTMAQNVMSGFADAPRGDRNFTVADPVMLTMAGSASSIRPSG